MIKPSLSLVDVQREINNLYLMSVYVCETNQSFKSSEVMIIFVGLFLRMFHQVKGREVSRFMLCLNTNCAGNFTPVQKVTFSLNLL